MKSKFTLTINPNWKEDMEKKLEQQGNCKHQWINTVTHQARRGMMGDKTTGWSNCRKCHKHDDLQWNAKTEKEWIEVDKRAKFRRDFE